jgi:biotin carboxylase
VDGRYPVRTFSGYEKKNELYLGSLLEYEDLPTEIKTINAAIAPLLEEFGYRNFIATEIRVKDGKPYFIDPTLRMPGQTGEQLLTTCSNLPEVIWCGANGELVDPEFAAEFSAEATLHYTANPHIAGLGDGWKTLTLSPEVRPWVKLYHYCEADGAIHFPPHKSDEVGVVIGQGDTIEEAIDKLKENIELLADEPVSAETDKFKDLLEEIHAAEEQGIEFTDQKVPEPITVIDT